MTINKCVFGKSQVRYLGHLVTPDGILPLPDKVAAISSFKEPTIAKDLRRFIAMVNFYRRFIPAAAQTQDVLQKLIRGNAKNDKRTVIWTDVARAAFNKFKSDLATATLLGHPHENAVLILSVDASNNSIGGVLNQIVNNNTESQQNWSAYSRELLAIYKGVKHFQDQIEGRRLIIYTDYKPISFALRQKSEKTDPRHLRQLHYISQFKTEIRYIRGIDNVVPDFLSRIEEVSSAAALDFDALAAERR